MTEDRMSMNRTLASFADAMRVAQSVQHPAVKDVAIAMLLSGVRLRECLELRGRDVDLAQSMITIRSPRGPGRSVPINENLKEVWQGRSDNGTSNELVFWRKDGCPLTAAYCSTLFRRAGRDHGIEITLGDLRRIYERQLLYAGVNIATISMLLGRRTTPWTYYLQYVKHDQ